MMVKSLYTYLFLYVFLIYGLLLSLFCTIEYCGKTATNLSIVGTTTSILGIITLTIIIFSDIICNLIKEIRNKK